MGAYLKIVDLASINISDFTLFLFSRQYVINLVLTGTIFSKNGAIC